MKALSRRAEDILLLIDEATTRDDDQKLTKYFVPSSRTYYRPWLKDGLHLTGSGDARILRSLATKGLTIRPKPSVLEFGYAITEDGRIAAEAIMQKRGLR